MWNLQYCKCHKNICSHIPWHHPLIPPEKPKNKAVPVLGEEGWFVLISVNIHEEHKFCIPSRLSLLEYSTSWPPPKKMISLHELIIWAVNGKKQPQVSSTESGTVNRRWRLLPWEYTGILPIPEPPCGLNVGTQRAGTAAASTGLCCCCSVRGMLLLPNPGRYLPGKAHFPKPARAEDFLWCAERGTLRSNEYLPTL